jgi:cytochrome c biogenesis protein CcdA
VEAIAGIRLYLYKILGVAAIILGILNIKNFLRYKPGGLATEMPISWRPKVKRITSAVTSTKGAFIVGIFVTIFLLPCTIGPYVIAGGILSVISLLETIPWLVLYNLVFVLPMLAITFVIYIGYTTVENVSGWKERNIRYLHLIAGIIMFLLGVAMLFGLIA